MGKKVAYCVLRCAFRFSESFLNFRRSGFNGGQGVQCVLHPIITSLEIILYELSLAFLSLHQQLKRFIRINLFFLFFLRNTKVLVCVNRFT